jgi:hypothetical protein
MFGDDRPNEVYWRWTGDDESPKSMVPAREDAFCARAMTHFGPLVPSQTSGVASISNASRSNDSSHTTIPFL